MYNSKLVKTILLGFFLGMFMFFIINYIEKNDDDSSIPSKSDTSSVEVKNERCEKSISIECLSDPDKDNNCDTIKVSFVDDKEDCVEIDDFKALVGTWKRVPPKNP